MNLTLNVSKIRNQFKKIIQSLPLVLGCLCRKEDDFELRNLCIRIGAANDFTLLRSHPSDQISTKLDADFFSPQSRSKQTKKDEKNFDFVAKKLSRFFQFLTKTSRHFL